MEVKFEKLKEEDLEETYKLCMDSFGDNASLPDVKQVYSLCKDDSHYHFIVGKIDNKIVAYATMVVFHNLFDGVYPVATLWYVCVDKNYRRQGIAKKMFGEIERIANQNKCEIIYFTSLQDNVASHKFYKSVGYTNTKEKAFVKYLFEEWEK